MTEVICYNGNVPVQISSYSATVNSTITYSDSVQPAPDMCFAIPPSCNSAPDIPHILTSGPMARF
jgi:hypothetical protein